MVATTDLSHITENAYGIADYTSISYSNESSAFILNGTSSTIEVGGHSITALSILEPEGTITDLSTYTGGIWLSGTGNGDYIDTTGASLGIEYSFASPSSEKDWSASLKFADIGTSSYTMDRDGEGVLSFKTHSSSNLFDAVGFYGNNETVNAAFDSNDTLTATATNGSATGTLVATNVTYLVDGNGNDMFSCIRWERILKPQRLRTVLYNALLMLSHNAWGV